MTEKQVANVEKNSVDILSMIERGSRDKDMDVAKFRALLDIKKEIDAEDESRQFNAALSAAQGKMLTVSQDAANPQTRSKYASYAQLDKAMRPVYSGCGFAVSFTTLPDAPENHVRVLGELLHCSGHIKTYQIDMPNDGKGAKGGDVMTKTHAQMSAISYAKRALMKMMFNIAEGASDDDGNSAGDDEERVSDTQIKSLEKLAKEKDADMVKIRSFYKIGEWADLSRSKYNHAHDALERISK